MSKHLRKVVAFVSAVILWLAGAFPSDGLSLVTRAVNAAVTHPIRAACVIAGIALAIYALWDQLLDLFGIQTIKRVETDIRKWLDAFRFSIRRESDKDTYFALVATPELGPPMVVLNPRGRLERYVVIQGNVEFSKNDKEFFDGLSDDEQGAFGGNLGIVLSRSRASFKMDLKKNELVIQRRVPITKDLNEYLFMSAVEDFLNARIVAVNALVLMLRDAQKNQRTSLATVPLAREPAKP